MFPDDVFKQSELHQAVQHELTLVACDGVLGAQQIRRILADPAIRVLLAEVASVGRHQPIAQGLQGKAKVDLLELGDDRHRRVRFRRLQGWTPERIAP